MGRERDESNLIEILYRDHASMQDLFWRLRRSEEGDRGELLDELSRVLVRHEVAEEVVVFPFLRSLPGGADTVTARLHEQQKTEEDLIALNMLDPTRSSFADGVARLEAGFMAHVSREEAEVFPLVELNASIPMLERMGARFEASQHSSVTAASPVATLSAADRSATIISLIEQIRRASKAS